MSPLSLSRFRSRTAAVLLIAGAPLFGAPAEAEQTQSDKSQTTDSAAKPAPKKVYEGMPAAELQGLIGKPEKIVPAPTKKGHAEVWIYKRLKHSITDTVTVGTKPVTIRQKRGEEYVDVVVSEDPIIKNRRTDFFEVAAFLIVNGQYVTCTNTEEKQESFF